MPSAQFWRGTAKAIAAVEFAVASPVLFLLLAFMVDYGFLNHANTALNAAVSAGAQYAYLTGITVTASNVQTLVKNTSGLTGVTAVVTGPACYCVTGTTPSLTLSAAGCNVTCPDGVTKSGYYVVINATYNYSAFMPNLVSIANHVSASQTVQLQ